MKFGKALRILTVFTLIYVMLVPLALAINITEAEIKAGAVEVVGRNSAKRATISWEGRPVTKSNGSGVFRFVTIILPLDCVGDLSDGVTTIPVVVRGCTTEQGGEVRTGQTTCYDSAGNGIACAGTGQDGELQQGAARSYTDNGDGTITDNATGLEWEKLTNDGSIHDWDNTYTWSQAFQKIAALNTPSCFAGHCDWRLPNVNELQTLADYGRNAPAIDPVFNNGVDSFTHYGYPPYLYWSSTTYQVNVFNAWFVNFNDGSAAWQQGVKTSTFPIRAVRGP